MPVADMVPLAVILHSSAGPICRAAMPAFCHAQQMLHSGVQNFLASVVIVALHTPTMTVDTATNVLHRGKH